MNNFKIIIIIIMLKIHKGRPFSLQNCSISNQSSDAILVECMEGFDGGLPQTFHLELIEMTSLRLIRNLSLMVSTFFILYQIGY